jgi:hypothetical protein
MTQLIEPSEVGIRQVVNSGSRYEKMRIVYYGEQRILTFETYVRAKYVEQNNESILVITKGLEYRPDLVSFDYYGYVDNWWKIMEANKILDIWDFKAGRTIMLPDISRIM